MGIGIDREGSGGMAIITVKKQGLLDTLRINLASHKATHEGAMAGYRLALIAACESRLADAKAGKRYVPLDLAEPHSNEKDYERVIRMLEMSVADEIQITEQEFDKYVMDEWGWKRGFVATSMRYGAMGG